MSIAVKTARSNGEMVEMIEGSVVASGSAGTNTAGSPNFSDLTTDAFASVSVGDHIYISGESGPFTSGIGGPFTVLTKSDNNNLVFTQNITNAHTANAKWKAKHGGIGAENLVYPPLPSNTIEGYWKLIYYVDTFTV